MKQILQKIRDGEIIRIEGEMVERDIETTPRSGYLMLAADRVSIASITQQLQQMQAATAPIICATRDRLEQMDMLSSLHSNLDARSDEQDGDTDDDNDVKRATSNEQATVEIVAFAASCITGSNVDKTDAAFEELEVRCVDWGGVMNCPRPFEAAVDLCRLAGLSPAAVLCRYIVNGSMNSFIEELPSVGIADLVEHRKARASLHLPRRGPQTRLPTRYGNFNLQAYEDPLTAHLHIALWMGPLEGAVLTRIHSECLTGDLFGSLRCDCGNQLEIALSNIAEHGQGVLLYLRQEGRGIGLINKLRTYELQDEGFDTVEANEELGFAADLRDYGVAGQMLDDMGVKSVQLLTNNPRKIRGLESHGIEVDVRKPLLVEPCSDSKNYLEVKRKKLGHMLP